MHLSYTQSGKSSEARDATDSCLAHWCKLYMTITHGGKIIRLRKGFLRKERCVQCRNSPNVLHRGSSRSRPHGTHLLLCPREADTVSKLPALGPPICCLALSMGSPLIGPPAHTRYQRLGYMCGKYLLRACGLCFHLVRGVFLAQGFVILM